MYVEETDATYDERDQVLYKQDFEKAFYNEHVHSV